jgi:hypothetical protein
MYLAPKSSMRATQRLICGRAIGSSRRTGIGTNNRAVDANMLKICIVAQCQLERVPNAELAPTRKALEDTVPCAEAAGEHTPLGAAAKDPKHGLDKSSTTGCVQ